MKAAVWHGVKDIRVEEVEDRATSGKKVKVKVAWAGICGSDLHAYSHDLSGTGLGPQVGEPNRITGRVAPITMGHEFSGVVTEVGPEVTTVSVGDRVAIEPIIRDSDSKLVAKGLYNLDENGLVGFNDDGGFAEYVNVEEYRVHKIPDHLSLEEAAVVEPMAVVMHALRESKFKTGMTTAVFGAGPIGLLTVLALKAAGATEIFLVDVVQERLDLGKEIGATRIINSLNENPEEIIRTETGNGVDTSFEAAGVQATLDSSINVIKKSGELVVLSIFGEAPQVDLGTLMVNEIRLTTTFCYRNIFPEVLKLMGNGQLDVKPLITNKINLNNIVSEGFEKLITDKSEAKILVSPDL